MIYNTYIFIEFEQWQTRRGLTLSEGSVLEPNGTSSPLTHAALALGLLALVRLWLFALISFI